MQTRVNLKLSNIDYIFFGVLLILVSNTYGIEGLIGGAFGLSAADRLEFSNPQRAGNSLSVINDLNLVGNNSTGFLTFENSYVYQYTTSTSSNIISIVPMYKYCFIKELE